MPAETAHCIDRIDGVRTRHADQGLFFGRSLGERQGGGQHAVTRVLDSSDSLDAAGYPLVEIFE